MILLVFADPVRFPPAFPYGRDVLERALTSEGLRVETLSPYIFADPPAALREACARLNPRIVGLSFRNLDTAGFGYDDDGEQAFVDQLTELAQSARAAGKSTIVLGGSGFSIAPRQLLVLTGADVGFVGNSEKDFSAFCVRHVYEGRDVAASAAGLSSALLPEQGSAELPQVRLGWPRRLDPSAIEYAKLAGGTVPVRTKSGCSLRCTYCVVPWIERLNLRLWEDIRRELAMVVEAGMGKRVFIADGEFNLPSVDRAIELCRNIRDAFGGTVEWRCYLEAGYVTTQLLEAMKEASCVGISLTADSYADPTRIGFAKGTKAIRAIEATRQIIGMGFSTVINLLLGGPRETLQTVMETATLARGFHDDGAALAVTIGLRVYPNTPFEKLVQRVAYAPHYRRCKKYDWLGVFCSPVSRSELAAQVQEILPPSKRIYYTNTLSAEEQLYYGQIAVGAQMLVAGDYNAAKDHFDALAMKSPKRLEARLGQLKAEAGLRSSS